MKGYCEICNRKLKTKKSKRCYKHHNIGRILSKKTKNKIRRSVLKNPRKSKLIEINKITNWNKLSLKVRETIYNKIYAEKYKKRITELRKEYYHLNKNNPRYILPKILRCRVKEALKRNKKSLSTMKLIGCSIQELRQHLENQFKKGMSWANYGKWHIDHIKSCCQFDLSKTSEQKKCFHYTNLQPLWANENLRKKKGVIKCKQDI